MQKIQSPSLLHDLGALAGLYRNVFWMMVHKEPFPQAWPRAGASRLVESAIGEEKAPRERAKAAAKR